MMGNSDLCYKTAHGLSKLIRAKEVSPVEVFQAYLDRINDTDATLNSFISYPGEEALQSAQLAEREILAGHYRGPLHGIPVGLKDIFYVKDVKNTAGSKIFDGFVPSYDSTVAALLRAGGAVLMGKLNLHQFAFGPTGLNEDYGNMHNPWDIERLAGGSSGGSGSAVASGQLPLALGTDTGGSVRIPASLCGITGLKPTYGRISRYGVVPLAWSFDHVGPMTRNVWDSAMMLDVIAGRDVKDPSSSLKPVDHYVKSLTGEVKGLRLGVPKEYFELPLDPAIEKAIKDAIGVFNGLGVEIKEVSWPIYQHSANISTPMIYAEAAEYHRDLLRKYADKYDPSIRWRVETGLFISGSDYLNASRARAKYTTESLALFDEVDLLIGPTIPVIAPRIKEDQVTIKQQLMGVIPALTQYTRAFNLTGFPALTVPCGFSEGMPIGMQLAGRPFDEARILNAGYAYQQLTDWHRRRPCVH
jgi:aspartyl-tRNA(Asn)/glutamyl-tRNA(Gln) amidotransferase subunit A